MNQIKTTTILGIRFFSGTVVEAAEIANRRGGLILAPSGPGLASLREDRFYRDAVENCDLALPDSGFMVLLWRFLKGGDRDPLERLSGLKFLAHLLLEDDAFRTEESRFWIMPSEEEQQANRAWLLKQGLGPTETDCYVAPRYPSGNLAVEDNRLLQILAEKRPRYIIVNIGGGVQEKLGHYLQQSLPYTPAIICTGAAIAFLSGRQATIPPWADRIYLGWLLRCLRAPATFIPRYWNALGLLPLLFRFREKSPPPPTRGQQRNQ